MLLIRFYIFSLLLYSTLNDIPKDKTIFISPLKIPEFLSSNFGELRTDHFHSGLDIKTQSVTGKEVVATADGYIYRIGVSPVGFGNSLFIRHPSGYSTVYGHLERFAPEIEKYVKKRQYEEKSFTIVLWPTKDEIPVKQGDLIAWSGNSGGSGGPHLHYEIRKSEDEKPINPLLFDSGILDNIKPVFEKLAIYPANQHTLINNRNAVKRLNVSGSNGTYFIPSENEITISGLAGFGIKAYDTMDNNPSRFAVYSIELSIDSISIFKYRMDGFLFSESRYVNSHIDYETFMKEGIYIERAFVLPGDRLSVYKRTINRGLFNFKDNETHLAEIIVTDAYNNKSTLTFRIRAQMEKRQTQAVSADQNLVVMPYEKSNKFTSENVSLNIPSGALYDTLRFSYKMEKGTNAMYSDLYYIHNKFTPLHKAFTLSVKPTIIPAGKESKMLLVRLDDDLNRVAATSIWTGAYLTADLLSFGRYYISIDTIAPVISANGLLNGANLTGKKEIKIRIKDELSGIKSYEPIIDGNWALFEYDQKNDLLVYKFDETRIKKGSEHTLSLKVIDNKDNSSIFKCNFTW
jgi:Peptidase family M23